MPIARTADHETHRSFYVKDPDGNELEVFIDLFDPKEARELMRHPDGATSEPLALGEQPVIR